MKPYSLAAGGLLVAAACSQVLAQTQIDLRTQAKSVDFSQAGSTKPSKTGTMVPSSCSVGEMFLKTDAEPGANLYVCTALNVWTVQGGSLPYYEEGAYGKILMNDESGPRWQSLDGDVTGEPAALTVNKLQGRAISAAAPVAGHLLSWSGTQWTPQAPALGSVFGRTGTVTAQSGDYSAGQVTNAVDRTTANTYGSGAKQSFTASAGSSGLRVLPAVLPAGPQAGDLAVDSTDSNRVKAFDGAAWVSLASIPNYFTSFTAATAVAVAGNVHRLGTANLVVECYDNATPAARVEPDRIRIDPTTYDVTVTFAVPQTGRLVINAAGGGSSNGAEAGAVLDFPSIPVAACAPEQTFALAGAFPGDQVAPGWPSGLEAGLMGLMRVTAADTVAVRLCNFSGAPLNPAGATFHARLVRNF